MNIKRGLISGLYVWIFVLMAFYIGFPFTYYHKPASPTNVSVIVLSLLLLTFAIFWKDVYKLKKDKLAISISTFIILLALLRRIFFYPLGFQIYDLWFLFVGAYYIVNESSLKKLLKFSSILLALPSLLMLYSVCWSSSDLFFALIAGFVIAILFPEQTKRTLKELETEKRKAIVIIVLSILVFTILSLQFLTFDPGAKKQGKILFDEGHGTIESALIPFNTNYNVSAPFGHEKLVEFLNLYNYSVETTNRTITKQLLNDCDVLVLIMCGKDYSLDETHTIEDFVRNGGGLLVIGDHTNIGNVMHALNPIIENFGIHMKFDTVWLKTTKKSHLHYAYHPILWNLNEVYLSVGSSLNIFQNAKPVLIAKYADFSDVGDPVNIPRAYLGNEIHDSYEDVGDLILIASSKYERGRVVVFSDSTYFQNVALPKNYKFVLRVFDWLNRENALPTSWVYTLPFLIFAVGIALYYKKEHILPLCFIISIVFALIASSYINTYYYPEPTFDPLEHKVMLDMSHQSRYTTYWESGMWSDTGLDALYRQILRIGHHPFIENENNKMRYKDLKRYSTLIIIAPNTPYSREEINAIQMFVNKGGGLLIVDGERRERIIDPLLSEFNITLGSSLIKPELLNNTSLVTQFPYGKFMANFTNHALTQNISSISFANPCIVSGGKAIAFIDKQPVMSVIHYGRGRIVVVGDDLFFSNYMLESEQGEPLDQDKLKLTWNILKYLSGEEK